MRCRCRSLVVPACFLFLAAILLAVPDPANCRKTVLDPPVLREARGIWGDPHIMLITANGVAAGQPGGYSISQSGPPHAYVLAETELAPAMTSHGEIALLALAPAAALLWTARRRRWRPAGKV